MNTLKITLISCVLTALCTPSPAQTADNTPDPAPQQLLAQQIKHRTRLAQQIAAKHLLARVTADELMAQHKFGLARHTLRHAQQVLHSHRDDLPQSVFTFIETLGREKLLTIDKQELIFLRKRLAAERARRRKTSSKTPPAPQTTTAPPPRPTTSPPAQPLLKPSPTPRLVPAPFRSVRRGLKTRISVVQYDDVPFADVLNDLRARSGSNIVANWQALENLAIEKTTPVSLKLRNVTAARALKLILQNLSTPYARISYIIQDNVVYIAPSEDLDTIFELRVYDVSHTMFETKDMRGGPRFPAGGYRSSDRTPSDRPRPQGRTR